MTYTLRALVRFDAIAAGVAGLTQLLGAEFFAPWSGLSPEVFARLGMIGLCYAAFSGTLTAFRLYRPALIHTLVFANLAYSAFLLVLLVMHMPVLTALGIVHPALESAFVAVLAGLEYRAVRQARSW